MAVKEKIDTLTDKLVGPNSNIFKSLHETKEQIMQRMGLDRQAQSEELQSSLRYLEASIKGAIEE